MIQTLAYSPGQTATIFLETLDTNGQRADGYITTHDGTLDGYVDGYTIVIDDHLFGYADGYTATADGYSILVLPAVSRLVFPDLTLAEGYPAAMTRLDVGLYYYQFILPIGATAVGSYLIDIAYTNPSAMYANTSLYQIQCNSPYGIYSVTTY
jgi:hypothetical protein